MATVLTSFVLPIVVAVFASTGFWSWLAQRKASNKTIMTKLDQLSAKVDELDYKVERNEAVSCRARLLRFNKELISKEKHTAEEYDQCLEDCDKYEAFCDSNPKFRNNKATLSIANIKKCYQKCCEDGDFL